MRALEVLEEMVCLPLDDLPRCVKMFLFKTCTGDIFKPGGLGVTGRPGAVGGDADALGGTGIPIIGLKPGNRHFTL